MGTIELYRAEDGSTVRFQENVGWSVYDKNGNLLFSLSESGSVTTNIINLSAAQASLSGTSAGSAVSNMPLQGLSCKKFIVYLSGYKNTTSTAQTITFPTAFAYAPKIVVDDSSGASVSATTLTLPVSMSGAVTGWIVVEGY